MGKYLWKQKLKCTLFGNESPISPLSSLPINIHKHCPVYQAWPLLQMSRSGYYSCDNANPQKVGLSDVWWLEALVGQLITTAPPLINAGWCSKTFMPPIVAWHQIMALASQSYASRAMLSRRVKRCARWSSTRLQGANFLGVCNNSQAR